MVGVDLSTQCFSIIVAYPRVGNAQNLFILTQDGLARNRVYKEILL